MRVRRNRSRSVEMRLAFSTVCSILALLVAGSSPAAFAQELRRVLAPGAPPTQATEAVRDPWLSTDGRHVVFVSASPNFTASGLLQVFRYSLDSGELRLLSRNVSTGVAADAASFAPVVSADGRYTVFESTATNLGPIGSGSQLFRAEVAGAVRRVSESPGGAPGNEASRHPALSADGRHVAFHTLASNLLAADGNGLADIVLKDLETGATELINRTASGGFGNASAQPLTPQAMSADARFVVFSTAASDTVAGGINTFGVAQVYLRDRSAGTTRLLSRNGSGEAANGTSDQASISADGRYVVFRSVASNLGATGSRLFVVDTEGGTLQNIPLPQASDFSPPLAASAAICREGRISNAGDVLMICNLLSGQPAQVFRWRRSGGAFQLLSRGLDSPSTLGNAQSGSRIAQTPDGTSWVFESQASNLVAGDSNAITDVFYASPLPTPSSEPIFRNGFEPL